jgi:glycosidase
MFPPDALRAWFTTNHDENSHSGSEYERLGEAAKPFAVFCCTWNGIPLIYSGQEMPLTRRLKFFDKDPIEWNGKYELHDFYKTLLTLRTRNNALRAGDVEAAPVRLLTNANKFVFAFFRRKGNDRLLVLLNLSNENKPLVHLGEPTAYGEYQNIFTGSKLIVDDNHGFSLSAWDYQVYSSPSARLSG